MPNYILYLEEHGFQVSEYSNNMFIKEETTFRFQSPLKRYNSIMYKNRSIHKLDIYFDANFILNYELIGFFFDFLNHAYNESKKYRKERTMLDVDLDVKINIDMEENRYCMSRVIVDSSTILSYFVCFDIQRLEYNVIYKEHKAYINAVEFNKKITDKWNEPENNSSDLL